MTLVNFMAKHYYITSLLIVITFGYSFVMAIVRWTTERSERQFREGIEGALLNQNVRIQQLEELVESRIQTLENNQREILRTLQEIRDAVQPPS